MLVNSLPLEGDDNIPISIDDRSVPVEDLASHLIQIFLELILKVGLSFRTLHDNYIR